MEAMGRIAIVLCAAAAGCRSPTEAILSVSDEDLAIPTDIDAIRIEAHAAGDLNSLLSSADVKLCGNGESGDGCHPLPFTVLFVPGDNPSVPARIDLYARKMGADVIHDAFGLSFVDGQSLRLDLVLYKICAQTLCAGLGQVCGSDGKCAPINLAAPPPDLTILDLATADLSPPPRRVFLAPPTSGGFGGLTGADTLCQNAAKGHAWLDGGTYKAILSDSTQPPLTRIVFNQPDRNIVRADGKLVATDGTFWSPHHLAPIDQFADGHTASGQEVWVWTSFLASGMGNMPGPTTTCNNWTVGDGSYGGFVGHDDDMGMSATPWSNGWGMACSGPASLYCIEQ
jgi:hypothetical protein